MAAPYEVRPVRAHEWREIRALRLAALSDPAAPMAFLESRADSEARTDEFWQDRARNSSVDAGADATARQFVATTTDGRWVGTVTVLVERAGATDLQGAAIEASGGHLVGIYLHPDHRGRGLLGDLIQAVAEWLRALGMPRARLYVHADNTRAQRAYAKAGFRATGAELTGIIGPELEMARPL